MFTFIQYGTYDICPGPVFQCEFNGGVRFVIRLTIFGNFLKCAIYTPLGSVFQREFNGGVCFVIRLTIFGNFSKCAIYTPLGSIFQHEFNDGVCFVIRLIQEFTVPHRSVCTPCGLWSLCESVCTLHGLCRVASPYGLHVNLGCLRGLCAKIALCRD